MSKLINKTLLLSDIDTIIKEKIEYIKESFDNENQDFILGFHDCIKGLEDILNWDSNNIENYNFELGGILALRQLKELL